MDPSVTRTQHFMLVTHLKIKGKILKICNTLIPIQSNSKKISAIQTSVWEDFWNKYLFILKFLLELQELKQSKKIDFPAD